MSKPLPHKEGFKVVRVGDILKLDSELSVVEPSVNKLPLLDRILDMNPLYYVVSAYNSTMVAGPRPLRILRESGFILDATVTLFDASKGPVCIPDSATFWKLKSDDILPHYLLLELHNQSSQFCNMDLVIEGIDSVTAFAKTEVYIPEGDAEFSLYEQQRIFDDYRTKELEKMSAALNMGVGVDGALARGSLLQGGKFIIDEYISGGGFGKVYKAKETKSHKTVAIKELYVKNYCSRKSYGSKVVVPEVAQKSFARQMRKFQSEFAILDKLNKATNHVPKVIGEPFQDNATMYYVMEYISGGTLWGNAQKNNLTNKQIYNIICQAGIALYHAHNLDYLHLDVSPLNILNTDGNGVLIDFGSNKHYSNETNRITSVGQVARTKPFAAPEMLQQSVGQYFMQSDVYSLAASLYAALTADIPFYHGKDNDAEYMAHIEQKLKERFTPDTYINIILKALSYDIKDRYATVLDFMKSFPADLLEPEVLDEINSLTEVSGFNSSNHIVYDSAEPDADYVPDYTSEPESE